MAYSVKSFRYIKKTSLISRGGLQSKYDKCHLQLKVAEIQKNLKV